MAIPAEGTSLRAGIEKNKRELSETEIIALYKALKEVFDPISSGILKPHTVINESGPINVPPFELRSYDRYDKIYYESFNEALDVYSNGRTGKNQSPLDLNKANLRVYSTSKKKQ